MGYRREMRDQLRKAWKGKREQEVEREREAKRERLRRDARVTAEHGERAHRSCGRKRRYETEDEALLAAARRVLKGAPMRRAYHCEYCDGWHLTKSGEQH